MVVVSDRAVRTLKYLYGLASGVAVLRLSWLEVRRRERTLCVKSTKRQREG